jgi:hypothetical protein
MSFFDPKEDVIDIELTDYGKILLSEGKLKPVYYAFFDDDIIYDSQYAAITESATVAATRIEDETPRMKSFYSISSKSKVNTAGGSDSIQAIDTYQKENIKLGYQPIGTSTPSIQDAPYYECVFLKGSISGSSNNVTYKVPGESSGGGAVFMTSSAPKLDLNKSVFEGKIVDRAYLDASLSRDSIIPSTVDYPLVSPRLYDDKFIMVERDYILFSLDEENTENEFDNFSISISIVDEDSSGTPTGEVTKLSFTPEESNIDENGFLIAGRRSESIAPPTEDNVEYYLDILTDSEIDSRLLCALLPEDEHGQKIATDPLVDCEDLQRLRSANLRRDVNVPPAEGEDC